jgi:hypothetical protein
VPFTNTEISRVSGGRRIRNSPAWNAGNSYSAKCAQPPSE